MECSHYWVEIESNTRRIGLKTCLYNEVVLLSRRSVLYRRLYCRLLSPGHTCKSDTVPAELSNGSAFYTELARRRFEPRTGYTHFNPATLTPIICDVTLDMACSVGCRKFVPWHLEIVWMELLNPLKPLKCLGTNGPKFSMMFSSRLVRTAFMKDGELMYYETM